MVFYEKLLNGYFFIENPAYLMCQSITNAKGFLLRTSRWGVFVPRFLKYQKAIAWDSFKSYQNCSEEFNFCIKEQIRHTPWSSPSTCIHLTSWFYISHTMQMYMWQSVQDHTHSGESPELQLQCIFTGDCYK